MNDLKFQMADTAAFLVGELKAGRQITKQDRKFLNSWLSAQNAKAKAQNQTA